MAAISRTSSLGLFSHCQSKQYLCDMDYLPVGEVARVGVVCGIVVGGCPSATTASMACLATLGCDGLDFLGGPRRLLVTGWGEKVPLKTHRLAKLPGLVL